MKICSEEPYIGELHAVPTKFGNKLLSFHYLKNAISLVFQLMMKLLIHVIHLKAVRVEGTSSTRKFPHIFEKKKIVKSSLTLLLLYQWNSIVKVR